MSALPPEADIRQPIEHVRFVPKADMALVYRASKVTSGEPRKDPGAGYPRVPRSLFVSLIAASDGRIVMEDDVQQGTMDDEVTVIINETQLAELVHEHTNARSGGADHIGEGFLAHFGNDGFSLSLFSKIGHEEE